MSKRPQDYAPELFTSNSEPFRIFTFQYKNHKGHVSQRVCRATSVLFMSTEWHPEPQWIMTGFDFDKQAVRSYAMKDMSNVKHLAD